jgi:hypothetical protein
MSSDPRGTVYDGRPAPAPVPPRRRGIMRAVGFFDTTAKVIGAVTALILAVAGLWAAIVQLTGPSTAQPDGPNQQTVAAQVQACESAHKMAQASDVLTSGNDIPYAFRSCQWPAPPYADDDGFTQITVTTVTGVQYASEADNNGYVDRIRGPCKTFEFAYDHGKMGAVTHLGPIRAEPGALLIGGDGVPYPGPEGDRPFYPGPDEVDVFHNSSYVLAKASCRA